MARSKHAATREKRPQGGFLALPHIVLRSDQFAALAPGAVKLLLDLLSQYDGRNNGDFTVAWTVMTRRRWKSNDSLYKALRELESRGWIQRTRQGGRHTATLWGVTIYSLDNDNPRVKTKLDILPSDFRRGAWAQSSAAPQGVSMDGATSAPPGGSMTDELDRPAAQLKAANVAIEPPGVLVETVSAHVLGRRADTSIEVPSIETEVLHPRPLRGMMATVDQERDERVIVLPDSATVAAMSERAYITLLKTIRNTAVRSRLKYLRRHRTAFNKQPEGTAL